MSEPLLNEIRATRPETPSALRERVRALSVEEPARLPFLARFRWRQLVLAAPVTVVLAVAAAGVIGLTRGGADGDQATSSAGSAAADSAISEPYLESAPATGSPPQRTLLPAQANKAAGGGAAVGPTPGQLQRFEAELSLRVDDVDALSNATKRAQRVALEHGGTVASLQYDAQSEGFGSAQITLRIPTGRVQSALAELSQLGTIVGQRYGVQDLQEQTDTLQTQIEQVQRQIAQIQAQLSKPTLSDESRVVLQSRLANARQKLKGLREGMRSTRAEAATSTVYLSLTTEEIEAQTPGGGSRLDDVKDVLAWEAIALLYFLVVAGPFIVLGFLIWLGLRLRRRQLEARLLAQN